MEEFSRLYRDDMTSLHYFLCERVDIPFLGAKRVGTNTVCRKSSASPGLLVRLILK